MHRDRFGRCENYSCGCRTPDGYCQVTACIYSVPTVTSSATSGDSVEFVIQSSVSDESLKTFIELYLKNHTLSDLMRVLADIV